jgi:hypothetical protein
MAGGGIAPPEGRYGSIDTNITTDALPAGNGADKRAFTYFVLGGARFLYATAARLAVISVVSTLSASADVLALSSVEVDLSTIPLGNTVTVKWRGKVRAVFEWSDAQLQDIVTQAEGGQKVLPEREDIVAFAPRRVVEDAALHARAPRADRVARHVRARGGDHGLALVEVRDAQPRALCEMLADLVEPGPARVQMSAAAAR